VEHILSKARVLITVKTYPLPSKNYDELVCTAGLLDGKRWVRIYPIPFRSMEPTERFKKWEWIELDLEKRAAHKDFRIESYQPRRGIEEPIRVLPGVNPKSKNSWSVKREYLLKDVQTALEPMIERARKDRSSIGVLKPKILEARATKEPQRHHDAAQQMFLDLIPQAERRGKFVPVQTLPYKFSYLFTSDDGKQHDLMVEDWEIGQLYRNALKPDRSPEEAKALVLERMEDYATNRDMFFIMGTTKEHHYSPSPFVIIGLFYPPTIETFGQMELL
jgi:hypothetical protein